MYSAQRRLKEFGIRKILGASVQHIMAIFSKEFVLLVGFSFLLAAPISWMLMDNWLQGFAYRIDLSWWIFLFAALIALGVSLLTISTQPLKAALVNPVEFLRDE